MTIRHFAAIAGVVSDQGSGKPVSGALVEIVSHPDAALNILPFGQPARATTGPDGHYHFLDLPDGAYQLSVTAAGAEECIVQAEVMRTSPKGTKRRASLPAWCNAELTPKHPVKSKE